MHAPAALWYAGRRYQKCYLGPITGNISLGVQQIIVPVQLDDVIFLQMHRKYGYGERTLLIVQQIKAQPTAVMGGRDNRRWKNWGVLRVDCTDGWDRYWLICNS
ncbi:hypothetical protein A6E23_18235 [Pseudomonas putida]|nr:hypothetical protein A6E23_18235 [Pseudomonas putida]